VRDRAKPKISIHADEVNELMGNEFIPLLNKAGGAGVQVTAYTQTWSDIVARLGDSAKAGQVMGNFNSLIMLRVRELETAELLTKQLPEVQVHSMTLVSGVTDTSDTTLDVDFTSTNQDRINVVDAPMLVPADLVSLALGPGVLPVAGRAVVESAFSLARHLRRPGDAAGRAASGRRHAAQVQHRRPVVGGGRSAGGERPWLKPPARSRRPSAAR